MLTWRDHSTDWTMLTVCLVPANVYSVQLYCARVHRVRTRITGYTSLFRPPPSGTRGNSWSVPLIQFCLGVHWSGPVCFKAADRIGIGSCPEILEGCGATGAIIFTLRPPRELFISTCCPCSCSDHQPGVWGDGGANERPGMGRTDQSEVRTLRSPDTDH